MKWLLACVLLALPPGLAVAQQYPSPTYQDLHLRGTLFGSSFSGSINNAPITGGSITGTSIINSQLTNPTISGGTITGTTFVNPTFVNPITGGAITGATITGSPISGSTGAFSTLSASGAVSGAGITALLAPYAPLASPAFSGTIGGAAMALTGNATIGGNTVKNPALFLNADGTGQSGLRFTKASVDRWRLMVTNAETGANSGSDLFLQNYGDAAAFISNLMVITRATGAAQYNGSWFVHQLTNDNSVPPIAQAALTGSLSVTGGGRSALNRTGGRFTVDNNGYVAGLDPAWASGQAYSINAIAAVGGYLIKATSSGTSGSTTPTCSPPAPTCSDGVVSWVFYDNLGSAYQMIGAFVSSNITSSYGGSPGVPIGVSFGLNVQANSSVANTAGVVGFELNYGSAFPILSRVGQQIVPGISGVSQGSVDDVALRFAAQQGALGTGAAPLKHLIDIGTRATTQLLDPNGYLLRVYAQNWNQLVVNPLFMAGAGGLDFNEFNPSGVGETGGGFIVRGPGSQILGSGDIQSTYALVHQTTSGASLDASQFHVTSAALHAGGGGSGWAGAGYFATCADGSIVTISTVSGGAVTAVALKTGSYNSAAPTNPVTCTSEQLVGTAGGSGGATLPSTIQVDMTASLANSGAPVLALGGVADVSVAAAKIGFYGHAAVTQPVAPVTLADVIAIIRGNGLSQ